MFVICFLCFRVFKKSSPNGKVSRTIIVSSTATRSTKNSRLSMLNIRFVILVFSMNFRSPNTFWCSKTFLTRWLFHSDKLYWLLLITLAFCFPFFFSFLSSGPLFFLLTSRRSPYCFQKDQKCFRVPKFVLEFPESQKCFIIYKN